MRRERGRGKRVGSTLKCNTDNFWLQFSTCFFCRLRFGHKSVVHISGQWQWERQEEGQEERQGEPQEEQLKVLVLKHL